MKPGLMLTAVVDDNRIGSGFRRFMLLEINERKHTATLLYLPTLAKKVVPLALLTHRLTSFDESPPPRGKTAKRIKGTIEERKRLGLGWSLTGSRAALALLKGNAGAERLVGDSPGEQGRKPKAAAKRRRRVVRAKGGLEVGPQTG